MKQPLSQSQAECRTLRLWERAEAERLRWRRGCRLHALRLLPLLAPSPLFLTSIARWWHDIHTLGQLQQHHTEQPPAAAVTSITRTTQRPPQRHATATHSPSRTPHHLSALSAPPSPPPLLTPLLPLCCVSWSACAIVYVLCSGCGVVCSRSVFPLVSSSCVSGGGDDDDGGVAALQRKKQISK